MGTYFKQAVHSYQRFIQGDYIQFSNLDASVLGQPALHSLRKHNTDNI